MSGDGSNDTNAAPSGVVDEVEQVLGKIESDIPSLFIVGLFAGACLLLAKYGKR